MAEFVLNNNNILNLIVRCIKQKSVTAIGTKFAPPYACIYMDEFEMKKVTMTLGKT